MKVEKLWKPSSCLPWRAERMGTETRVWYTIIDCVGNEIMTTDKWPIVDEHQALADVAFILCLVNNSRTILVNNKPIRIEWYGENNDEIRIAGEHAGNGEPTSAGPNPAGVGTN